MCATGGQRGRGATGAAWRGPESGRERAEPPEAATIALPDPVLGLPFTRSGVYSPGGGQNRTWRPREGPMSDNTCYVAPYPYPLCQPTRWGWGKLRERRGEGRGAGQWNDPITSSGSLRVLPKWFHSHGVRIAIGLFRIATVMRVPIRPGAVI